MVLLATFWTGRGFSAARFTRFEEDERATNLDCDGKP